jgi:hypothetical protein
VCARRRRAIVLCLSDFIDTFHRYDESRPRLGLGVLLASLAEVSAQHRLLALQILDRDELEPRRENLPVGAKNCEFLDPEKFSDNERRQVDYSGWRWSEHRQRVKHWTSSLSHGLSHFGIKFEQIVAGRDDQQVDKKICTLGTSTGM